MCIRDRESGATPVVILAKKDLCEEPEYYVNLVARQEPGVAVCAVSAVTGEGMEHVQHYLLSLIHISTDFFTQKRGESVTGCPLAFLFYRKVTPGN